MSIANNKARAAIPGGVEGSIQFKSGTGFAGGASLVFDGSNIKLQDNIGITFGDSGDLKIDHDGTDSRITNNTGDLFIKNNSGDILVDRIVGDEANGLLDLRGAQGGTVGGAVSIQGGFGLTTPGRVNIRAGSTNSIGESVFINGGDGPTGKSGGVFLSGGTSGDDNGIGGDIIITGGQGGVVTGVGGDVTISSGDSEGALPGILRLKGGEQIGFSVFGAILMQENGGDVGIGTGSPSAKLDINGQIKIQGGVPGAGKVLTSNASGLATWETNVGTETLAATLVLGNTTGGTNIVITNGDMIDGDGAGDLILRNPNETGQIFAKLGSLSNATQFQVLDSTDTIKFSIDGAGDAFIEKQLGIGILNTDGTLHVHTASAGAIAASSQFNELVLENSGDSGLTILSPDAFFSGINFGSPSGQTAAAMRWKNTTNRLTIGTFETGAEILFVSGLGVSAITIDGAGLLILETGNIVSPDGTSGVPISITSGEGSSGNGGNLDLISGQGFGSGGAVNLTSGDGAFAGGPININSGDASSSNSSGGLISLQSGSSSGTASGGQVHVFAGIGGDNSGTGGQVLIHAGGGGNSQGDGGLLSLEGGQGFSSGNTDGGDVDIQGGQNFGTGVHGDVLIAKDGGLVGIGSTPIASALLNLASVTKGFMQPRLTETQRDAISSPATGLSIFDTDINIPEWFDGTQWKRTSAIGITVLEIFTAADLDAIASGGVITVSSELQLIFKDDVVTSNRFVTDGASLRMGGAGSSFSLTYTGTGDFLSGTGGITIRTGISLISGSTGTLWNMNVPTNTTVIHQNANWVNWDNHGTIKGGIVLFQNINLISWALPVVLDSNDFVGFTTIGTLLPPSSGHMIEVVNQEREGSILRFTDVVAVLTGTTTTIFKVDPAILESTQMRVLSSGIVGGGGNFETSDGANGTFASVTDVSVVLTTIDSVTDSSGVARFNFTVGPTLFVNQEVDISNFVTETSYNQTGFITAVGAGFFEIASIAFTDDDATGDFSSDSVELLEVGTALLDGDTLVIDTTAGTQYDGGATVYNQQVNSFQINRTFLINRAGTWNTSGIDQTDPRVLSTDSKYIGSAFANNLSTATTISTNNTFNDINFGVGGAGLVVASNTERFKLIDEVACIFEYIGNEPFSGGIAYDYSMISGGGTQEFRFNWNKSTDGGSVFNVLADDVESLAEVGSDSIQVSKGQPVRLNNGDQLKPQVTRNAGGSSITMQYISINIFEA